MRIPTPEAAPRAKPSLNRNNLTLFYARPPFQKGGLFCEYKTSILLYQHKQKKRAPQMWRPFDNCILLVPAVASLRRTYPYQVGSTIVLLLLVATCLEGIGVLDHR